MNEKLKGLCAIGMAAALAACGGGGDGVSDTPAPPSVQGTADKYVGAWDTKCITSNFVPGSEKSSKNRFDLTKANPSTVNGVITKFVFTTIDCTGLAVTTIESTGTITFAGTKVIGADVVDKTIGGNTGETPQKSISLRKDDKIFFPVENPPLDAEGFPDAIDPDDFVTKVQAH